MLRKTLFIALSLTGIVAAQDPGRPGGAVVPPPRHAEVRQFLGLTDAQATSLEQVQTNRREAEAAIYRQISEKQRVLHGLLEAGSNDALQIGQLTVEINNLRRRLPLASEPYRTSALAVLNDLQKAKLPTLAEALRLNTPAWQAVSLNLIDAPNGQIGLPRPIPLPMPVILPAEAADPETISARP